MRSQGVPSPFFPAQRGISDHLPLPTKRIPWGYSLRTGPRFLSRARSRFLAKAAHVSGAKICPEFAPRSRHLLRCHFDVGPDPRELLHVWPQAGDRAGVEQLLAGRPIPPECPATVLALESLYGL